MSKHLPRRDDSSEILFEEGTREGQNSVWLSPDAYPVHAPRRIISRSSPPDSYDRILASSAKRFLESVIDNFVVITCALVRVRYHGRASSIANQSPRIVITKPDGTLIVHESTKQRPLNWQPPGTKFYLSIGDDSVLVLEAFRKRDKETVTLWFDKLFYIAASVVADGEFILSGSESEMVDLVVQKPSMIEDGFTPEKREFRTGYGTVDLIGKDKDGNVLVLEFKRRQAQLSSVSQLGRYVESLREEREEQDEKKRKSENGTKGQPRQRKKRMKKIKFRGGIVAPAITPEALGMLTKMGYEFFRLEPQLQMRIGYPATSSRGSTRRAGKRSV
jgi:RecB family endonuclease NucS